MPRISIVTPAGAAEPALTRALSSVAAQTARDWEQLVVVEGSGDGGEAIARAAAAKDPRVQVIVEPQAGVAAARNAGLAAAQGEYVLFLDADATLLPAHLAALSDRLDASGGADIAYCGHAICDSQGRRVRSHLAAPAGDDPCRIVRTGPPSVLHRVMARRQLLIDIGGFDPELTTGGDWDLWLRAVRAGARFTSERQPLALSWPDSAALSADSAAVVRDAIATVDRAHRDGLALGNPDEGVLASALWRGAVEIGRGGDGMAATAALPATLAVPWQRDALAARMIDGLLLGADGRAAQLAAHWAEVAPRLRALVEDVGRRCGDPGLPLGLLHDIELEVARHGSGVAERRVGSTVSRPLTPAALLRAPHVPEGADTLLYRPWPLPAHPRLMLQATATGGLTAGELRGQLLGQMTRRFARGLIAIGDRVPALRGPIDRAVMAAAVAMRPLRYRPSPPPAPDEDAAPEPLAGTGTTENWDAFFGREDPWSYQAPYEQIKYEQTLALLGDRPIGRALELAIAEGFFSAMLAPRVEHLTATDISTVALQRAKARCDARGLSNIDYAVLDFFKQDIGTGWDLIVSSEVLYYMTERAMLEGHIDKVARGLNPGGLFLHAHAYGLRDSQHRTAFDWEDPFAAATMSEVFGEHPQMQRVEAVTTDLYRIELYRKVDPAQKAAHVADRELPMADELEPWVEAMVVWNGAIRTRQQAYDSERTMRLPVLMYHRVAQDGPPGLADWRITPEQFEHQLRYLHRRGYHSIGIDAWDEARRRSGSMRGRPILITFDDAYVDFAEQAWPILERNGFSAHVFVPTAKVGATADWDARHGEPAPLMSWDQIRHLHQRGVGFGSHLHTHRAADQLPVDELLDEALRSKALLEAQLGVPVTTVAPPFGAMNTRVEQVLRKAGYRWIFDAQGGIAAMWGTRWKVPRVEVASYDPIETFAQRIGNHSEPPEPGDLP